VKRLLVVIAATLLVASCSSTPQDSSATTDPRPSIVVTYSVLGALVKELVGDAALVTVVIPDGQDPHDFEPSAKDIEAINEADLVVSNGLGFEEGLTNALESAAKRGVPHFVVTDHVATRTHEGSTAIDPHVWLSPFTMSEMINDLATVIGQTLDVNLDAAADSVVEELTALDERISSQLDELGNCTLVTGHDELGYFADRYGCTVVGAVIPSFSTTAEASAGELADLEALVAEHHVRAIFTGLGTSADVVNRLSEELGIPAIELSTHFLNGVSTYDAFMMRLVDQVVGGLS